MGAAKHDWARRRSDAPTPRVHPPSARPWTRAHHRKRGPLRSGAIAERFAPGALWTAHFSMAMPIVMQGRQFRRQELLSLAELVSSMLGSIRSSVLTPRSWEFGPTT